MVCTTLHILRAFRHRARACTTKAPTLRTRTFEAHPAALNSAASAPAASPRRRDQKSQGGLKAMAQPRTMFQKIWDSHTVTRDEASGEVLLYVDRLLLTDTSSFHAFDILRSEGHAPRRPESIFGCPDHFA